MLQIADAIEAINQRGLTRAEERFAASAESLRWSLVATFGIALARRAPAGHGHHRHHTEAGEGTRTQAHRSRRTFRPAGARSGRRAPQPGARTSRRSRPIAFRDHDGGGQRRVRRNPGRSRRAREVDRVHRGSGAQCRPRSGACCCALPCSTISALSPRSTGTCAR